LAAWLSGNALVIGLDLTKLLEISSRMNDGLHAGKPSHYVTATQANSAWPSLHKHVQ